MKSLLLSLVVIPCLAWGQKKDSLSITKDNGLTSQTTTNVIIGLPEFRDAKPTNNYIFYNNGVTSYTQKQDTIKVLMLVCDTSIQGKVFPRQYRGTLTAWIFGYEVIEGINNMLWFQNYNVQYITSGFPYIVKEYIDENKKPLSKSIVVWQTKEIK